MCYIVLQCLLVTVHLCYSARHQEIESLNYLSSPGHSPAIRGHFCCIILIVFCKNIFLRLVVAKNHYGIGKMKLNKKVNLCFRDLATIWNTVLLSHRYEIVSDNLHKVATMCLYVGVGVQIPTCVCETLTHCLNLLLLWNLIRLKTIHGKLEELAVGGRGKVHTET